MRWRARLLHVIVIAPVAALTATALGPVAHARADKAAPRPIVVVVDPGHGGRPNNADPAQPFDPGAIGGNGVLEKDVALDVAGKLKALLEKDKVRVMLTRTSDVYVTIPDREQVANDNAADIFVSIHCNSFADPSVGGSLVLYPNSSALRFAQAMSDALGHDLSISGVPDDGVQLRDNWWIHAAMPTSTVEIAYLTNPHEAALMATEGFRSAVAAAMRDGIERYLPAIAVRRSEILGWEASHPGPANSRSTAAAVRSRAPADSNGSALGTVFAWMILAAVVCALVRWREPATRGAVVVATLTARGVRWMVVRRSAARRRRRRVRERSLARDTARTARPHSVYDELWL